MEAAWDEEAELRELNGRLRLFVRRVRALEEENRRLAQELAAAGREPAAGAAEAGAEAAVAELRRAVAELRRARDEAALEREALRGERAHVEALLARLGELRRRRLEPEAGELRLQLERLAADCAARQALLGRLRDERRRLRDERRRRPALRAGPRALPPPPPPPPPGALEETFALVLSWSWEHSLERHEAELRALQGRLAGAGDAAEALRARNRESRRALEELERRARELAGLAEELEWQRRAQEERQGAERDDYRRIIEALEEEKHFLTMSIAEYLKDYHELLQVKAGLSLEIATYSALLEGDSGLWLLMWEEEHGQKVPQGVRNVLQEYGNQYLAYQQEKGTRAFPAIQNVDTRYKTSLANMNSSAVYSSRTQPGRIQTAAPGKTLRKDVFHFEHRPPAASKTDMTHRGTFTPFSVISRESEVQRRKLPWNKTAEAVSTASFSKELTEGQKGMTIPNTFENIRPKVVGVSTTSYHLNSSSKETKFERTQEGTDARVNEQNKEVRPMKEGKPLLLQGRNEKERIVSDSVPAMMEKKLAGVETRVNFEKKVEIKRGTEEEKHAKKELSISESGKEGRLAEDETPNSGKYVKWEEHVRIDTSGKDLPSDVTMDKSSMFQKGKNTATQNREAGEMPVLSDMRHQGQPFTKNTEVTLQDLKPSVGKQKDEATPEFSKNIPGRELTEDRVREEGSPKMDAESIAENIVSDILKGFVQKSSEAGLPPDTKFTFLEKKISEDGKAKSEFTLQSTVQEDLNVSDESELRHFLEKDAQGVGATKEALSGDDLEDIINAALKGREGQGKRTLHVEIVEEPFEAAAAAAAAAAEQMEFPLPFEVEEVDDTLPYPAGRLYYGSEEKATKSAAEHLKHQQPSSIVSHVEEVSEGDDVVDEEKYFVSTPEELPLAHEKDDSSLYGQIHIEEESTLKYLWQDEFLQGSQKRGYEGTGSPEAVYHMRGEGGAFVSKDEAPVEQVAHAESFVIEREIKIPHGFHTSIKSLFSEESKDPKHQLKEALEKLEDSLPESVKQELSALTQEDQADSSSLEVDIKKMEPSKEGGLVTIVAEVNLSETLEPDQFITKYLGEGLAGERESPTRFSTTYGFEEYRKQGSESSQDGGGKGGIIGAYSTPWTTEEVTSTVSEQVASRGPAFKTLGLDKESEPSHLQGSVDINKSVRQIIAGPTEISRSERVLHEGPISETLEFGSGASANISQSVQGFTFGPEEIHTTEEITYRGPVRGTAEISGREIPQQAQFSAAGKSTKHVVLGSKQIIEDIVFEGPASDLLPDNKSGVLSPTQEATEVSRSVRHIRIDPKQSYTQQVVYEGPLSGVVEHSSAGGPISLGEPVRQIEIRQRETPTADLTIYEESSKMTELSHDPAKEGMMDTNTTVRHIKLAPKELVTTEQIVFKGPVLEQRLDFGESGQMFSSEGSVRHIKLGQQEVQSSEYVSYQGSVSKPSGVSSAGEDILEAEGPTEISRSFRQVKLGPVETHTEQIVFQGPVSGTPKFGIVELSPTDGPPESRSLGHIKIGPKETSFTFQMDLSNVEGGGQEAKIWLPDTKEAPQLEDTATGSERDVNSEQRSEQSAFEQTVQLQRMVDQRSMVSNEEKIALLYLNENEEEEEEEEEGGPWF